jgi:GT2 family glycosyltransferase
VPGAIVEHRYSHSAGRASPLKAYYVERNRLYTVMKNFPLGMLLLVRAISLARYFWHFVFMISGRGAAAEFRRAGNRGALLPWLVVRAHWAALIQFPRLLAERRRIRAQRRIHPREFRALLRKHRISVRQVAAL